ncbi:MAG: hypothetical protein ACLFVU_10530 [Phycisphaerae bacterium]
MRKTVSKDGRVRPFALQEHIQLLDAELRRMEIAGPASTPELYASDSARMAYWLNARAAWSMKLAALSGLTEEVEAAMILRRPFRVDGRSMTLEQIDVILAEDKDFRVQVARPGVLPSDGPLPRKAFQETDLYDRVARNFNAMIDNPDRLKVIEQGRKLLTPTGLWDQRAELIAAHHRKYRTRGSKLQTAVIPYVTGSAKRRLLDYVGYTCVPWPRRGTLPLLLAE